MKKCYKIIVKGVVQGVGFRPFVYRLAKKHKLTGWVCNTSQGVIVEIVGTKESRESFLKELRNSPPPAAKIDSIESENIPLPNYRDFQIKASIDQPEEFQPVSPDIATCDDCLKELFDPQDRRYHYPFINCTNCGPRFTIIEDIPYDRPKTTMKKFTMCPECQKEYDDPTNRRFHAQPNACPKCGPEVELIQNLKLKIKKSNNVVAPSKQTAGRQFIEPIKGNEAIAKTIELLKQGKIVAIKGLGGFHLACNALDDDAVKELRKRKLRRDKPFAVMMPDLETVKKYCYLLTKETELLLTPQRPIVLLKEREKSEISRFVAPNQKYQGVMLPYTPLHHLLFHPPLPITYSPEVLVMTSGNLSEEPIAMENKEAITRLKDIADYFLLHNRDIYSRYDDSVARVFHNEPCTALVHGEPQILRRARSYAPYPIHLPYKVEEILATGADLKNTFCLTKENYAFLSQHIGDLENLETLEHFENTLKLYKKLFRVNPKIIAYDLHPEYFSTKYALDVIHHPSPITRIGVQHHHAHIASCMIENNLPNSKVIGVAFDGTGYGTDGKIWGGEFFICDYQDFERVGHFSYLPLPGGDSAIKKPYRITISYLSALNQPLPEKFREGLKEEETQATIVQLKNGFNSPFTSSCGRFFDAVSALLGIRKEINYDAQAAIELEMFADETEKNYYPFEIKFVEHKFILDQLSIFACVLDDLKKGVGKEIISARFHNTIAQVILEVCKKIWQNKADYLRGDYLGGDYLGIRTVCLSGGVFQNLYLLKKTVALLEENKFKVYYQKTVPCNDGGISLGQAIIAHTRISTNK